MTKANKDYLGVAFVVETRAIHFYSEKAPDKATALKQIKERFTSDHRVAEYTPQPSPFDFIREAALKKGARVSLLAIPADESFAFGEDAG